MKVLCRFLLPALALAITVPARAFDCEGVTPVTGENVTVELVGEFSSLTGVAAPPGDTGRLFVVEQHGTIRIINLADDSPGPVFLDIQSKVRSGGESGLLGLAFHPDYATNGFFFVCYTHVREEGCANSPPPGCPADFRFGRTERLVARYQVSGDSPDRADPESEKVLLAFCQPAGNNIAGRLEFGPNDGYLYISSGDGSGRGCSHAQRMDTFLGKILRIDVDRGDPYGIPATNPYATTEGALPEIWALGLRNPWGFSFDLDNGDVYIGDVGSNRWEEIDYQPGDSPGGENYEYPVREGNHDFRDVPYGPGDRVRPTFEYPYGRTSVVIGGVVYRGCRMPDLHGRYFLADRQQNWVRSLVVNESGHAVDVRDHTGAIKSGISGNMNQIRSFGVDGRGEMYIVERAGGMLHRIIPPNKRPTARIETTPSPPVMVLVDGAAEILLDGSSSDDGGDGPEELTYSWRRTRGPTGDTIASENADSTTVGFTQAGEYRYRLRVNDGKNSDSESVTVTVEEPLPQFIRGDCNGDGNVSISDAVMDLRLCFSGVSVPCAAACDIDGDGSPCTGVTDGVRLLTYLFRRGEAPPAPFPACGTSDRLEDAVLGCETSRCE